MASKESKSPKNPTTDPSKRSPSSSSPLSQTKSSILSPGFRSVAAMAGWDEEALLLASLVVEDTPVRESRQRKRPTETSSNRSLRRSKKRPSDSMPAVVLCLDDEDEGTKKDVELKSSVDSDGGEEKMKGDGESKGLPCMDRLREELSCAICLEICFEPSTTLCGHSFCKKCLKCAATKCGKRCPKCRQLISNARSCTVNTVLWNTIQLLFPQEIEARRSAAVSTISPSTEKDVSSKNPQNRSNEIRASSIRSIPRIAGSVRNIPSSASGIRGLPRNTSFITATQVSQSLEHDAITVRRRASSTQSEDAALALRLQREELLGVSGDANEPSRTTLNSARANLRAMASRAYQIRVRGRY